MASLVYTITTLSLIDENFLQSSMLIESGGVVNELLKDVGADNADLAVPYGDYIIYRDSKSDEIHRRPKQGLGAGRGVIGVPSIKLVQRIRLPKKTIHSEQPRHVAQGRNSDVRAPLSAQVDQKMMKEMEELTNYVILIKEKLYDLNKEVHAMYDKSVAGLPKNKSLLSERPSIERKPQNLFRMTTSISKVVSPKFSSDSPIWYEVATRVLVSSADNQYKTYSNESTTVQVGGEKADFKDQMTTKLKKLDSGPTIFKKGQQIRARTTSLTSSYHNSVASRVKNITPVDYAGKNDSTNWKNILTTGAEI